MAIHAPITGAPTRAPAINRRNLLAAIAAVPAAAIPVAAFARPADSFDAAHARWKRAVEASRRFERDIYDPALAALDADNQRVPHTTFEYELPEGERRSLSTAVPSDLAIARVCLSERRHHYRELPEFLEACRKLNDAEARRMEKLDRLYEAHAIPPLDEHFDTLEEERYAAMRALFECSVADARQLADKMEAMEAESQLGLEYAQSALLADARRLAGRA